MEPPVNSSKNAVILVFRINRVQPVFLCSSATGYNSLPCYHLVRFFLPWALCLPAHLFPFYCHAFCQHFHFLVH